MYRKEPYLMQKCKTEDIEKKFAYFDFKIIMPCLSCVGYSTQYIILDWL